MDTGILRRAVGADEGNVVEEIKHNDRPSSWCPRSAVGPAALSPRDG
jgi:hypothetical protein